MLLQRVFALYTLLPALGILTPISTTSHSYLPSIHRGLSIQGVNGRTFRAELFLPRMTTFDLRYPGAIIVATEDTRDRAFLVASRMAEIGVTAMMYVQDDSQPQSYQVKDARAALDSMRRRYDVRSEEVGVIALEEATTIVPDLVRDTTLHFAIAASSVDQTRELSRRFTDAHAATLLVRGVKNLKDSASIVHALGLDGSDADTSADPIASIGVTRPHGLVPAPNVTVWPVPQDQLSGIGEARSPLSRRMVGWVRDQVHAGMLVPEDPSVVTSH